MGVKTYNCLNTPSGPNLFRYGTSQPCLTKDNVHNRVYLMHQVRTLFLKILGNPFYLTQLIHEYALFYLLFSPEEYVYQYSKWHMSMKFIFLSTYEK